MTEKKVLKLPITIFELVAYSLSFLLGLWGLVYIILGFVVNFLRFDDPLKIYDASIAASSKMGLLYQGLLILSIAVIVAVTILCIFAKSADRDFEKEQRRKQARMQRTRTVSTVEETVVEAEITPVEEKPAETESAPAEEEKTAE